MNPPPAIVVVAYNRTASLKRLLNSLLKAHYPPGNIDLIISIDYSGNDDVVNIANAFDWKFGNKKILTSNKRLGLKQHILQCGDLSEQYGSIIMLEDDLLVSPAFYNYAVSAAHFYKNDYNIAGISLFNYQVAENHFFPFSAVQDGTDVYFIQVASSWGQLFFAHWWKEFRTWLEQNDKPELPAYTPAYLRGWSANSWKKHFIHFLIQTNKYFVYPRVGLSTNFGEDGANTDRRGLFQTPLLQGEKSFNFAKLEQSKAIYDAWYEITPSTLNKFCPQLSGYNYVVDLHGTKDTEGLSEFILSSKKCYGPLLSFANDLGSAEENILENLPGNFYAFAQASVFDHSIKPDIALFYPGINSIRDLVFKSYMDSIQSHPPLLVIIIYTGDADGLKATLNSVFRQQYVASQLFVKVLYQKHNAPYITDYNGVEAIAYTDNEELFTVISNQVSKAACTYNVCFNSGDVFFDQAFNAVNRILRNYPDVRWVTGIETPQTKNGIAYMYGATAARRWNKPIFEKLQLKNNARRLPPAATFWKKELWDVARPLLKFDAGKTIADNLFVHFFTVAPLYTCEVYVAASQLVQKSALPVNTASTSYVFAEDNFLSKMWEYFFINNLPYLRSVYKNKNELKPVIRFDHYTQCYFLCDY
jgi:hypothetical protein